MQSQQMYPEENRYDTFEPAFSESPSFEPGYREYSSGSMGEKLHPVQSTKKRGRWLWQRVVLVWVSILTINAISYLTAFPVSSNSAS